MQAADEWTADKVPDVDIDEIVKRVAGEIEAQRASAAASYSPETVPREVAVNKKDDVKHVAIGSDHRGVDVKNIIITYLGNLGYRMADVGPSAREPVDYPDYAVAVAKKVASGECERGIMIDGTGVCSAMVCNKVRGIRAAPCHDLRTVVISREHANANVLTLGGPFYSGSQLCEMAKTWLETRFGGGRHWVRINKMMATERAWRRDGSE